MAGAHNGDLSRHEMRSVRFANGIERRRVSSSTSPPPEPTHPPSSLNQLSPCPRAEHLPLSHPSRLAVWVEARVGGRGVGHRCDAYTSSTSTIHTPQTRLRPQKQSV